MTITDETLMAFADGELDPAAAAAVEAALRDDPRLAAQLAEHHALRARVQAAFAGELAEPVPRRLIDAATRAPPAAVDAPKIVPIDTVRTRRERSWRRGLAPLAMAASLVLGIGIGFVAWHPAVSILGENAQGALIADGGLARALSDQLAGPGAAGGIDIGLSFLSKSGSYCRTFRIAKARAPAGVACRSGTDWRIDVLTPSAEGPGAQAAYRMAGSSLPPAVLAAVESRIVGQPLDRIGERAARRRAWRAPARGARHLRGIR
ncbi:MAG TPA: hypothetical protein VND80_05515 [Steroidobacteraceae bacterium]|nr:hypothetical protein [Steroidobacteraceae bacterium]